MRRGATALTVSVNAAACDSLTAVLFGPASRVCLRTSWADGIPAVAANTRTNTTRRAIGRDGMAFTRRKRPPATGRVAGGPGNSCSVAVVVLAVHDVGAPREQPNIEDLFEGFGLRI